ncbi:MAG: hypothetical protein V1926_06365 [Candidatus Peregrinibacteria bacterium]
MAATNNELPHRFEPLIAVVFAVPDSLIEVRFSLEKTIFLPDIFLSFDHSLQLHIEELLQLAFGLSLLFNETANSCPTVCASVSLLLIELVEHVLRPVVRQRDLFDDFPYLFKQRLFPEVLLGAASFLFGAAVVVMPFLQLRCDRASTRPALHEADEGELVFAPALLLASSGHHPLHLVEQAFGNEWLVFVLVELAAELQHPVIEGTKEDLLDRGKVENVSLSAS